MRKSVIVLALLLSALSALSTASGLKSGSYADVLSPQLVVSNQDMKAQAGQISFWSGQRVLSFAAETERAGLFKVLFRAWGKPCQNEWPIAKLTVAGKDVCSWTVEGNKSLYISPALELSAGVHEVKLSYINDASVGREDRNLYLDGVAFAEVNAQEELPAVLFAGKPAAAFGQPKEGTALKAQESAPAAVAPFYPPKQAAGYVSTVTPKEEITVTLPCGASYDLAAFQETRALNGAWKISGLTNSTQPFGAEEDLLKGYQLPQFDDTNWDEIAVPLDWYYKYPSSRTEKEPFVKGWYRKKVEIPLAAQDKAVILHFGVIGYEALLFVNGQQVGGHRGDFTPWEVEITDYVKFGADNTIALRVFTDFGNRFGSPYPAAHVYGSQWGIGNIKGGLWQDVSVRYEEKVRIESVSITPQLEKKALAVDWKIVNRGPEQALTLYAAVVSAMKGDKSQAANLPLTTIALKQGLSEGTVEIPLQKPELWSPENPYLYYLSLALVDGQTVVTARTERFGFRDFKVRGKYFYLNGKRIYLFGENIRAVDYGGRRVEGEEIKRALAEKLSGFKRQGYNIVRNAHLPVIPVALDLADEIGIMFYNEWAWAFTNSIAEEEFEKNNLAEIAQWVARDYNHPAVVMWSLGNEVNHAGRPDVCRQMDKQVALVRRLDRSGRPIGTFSGVASLSSYGSEKLDTDFLDLHTYHGLSTAAWTTWETYFRQILQSAAKVYGEDGRLKMPFIIWECVGFSWGGSSDPKFKPNEIAQYAQYAQRATAWAEPNGIGFAGTIGLAAALDPKLGLRYGREKQGKRIIETIRYLSEEIQGFAPWFHDSDTSAAALWNQPLLVGLRQEGGTTLTNLCSGNAYVEKLFLLNSQERSLQDLSVRITLVSTDGKTWPLAEVPLSALAGWEKKEFEQSVTIPQALATGNYQVRLQVFAGREELSRNFYDVFVRQSGFSAEGASGKVALWGGGEAARQVQTLLAGFGIAAACTEDLAALKEFDLLIMPPASQQAAFFEDSKHMQELLQWISQGGRYLQLEQNYAGLTPVGQELIPAANTFVDLVIPAHPAFAGLSQRQFDTWMNPDYGYCIEYAFKPFTINALAVRGPFLGARGVYNAVAEGTYGKGIIFTSQLLAARLWQRDSAAAAYLQNVVTYLLTAKTASAFTKPWEMKSRKFNVNPEQMVTLDLQPYATTGFADETDGDKKGGWTDQGSNDLRMIPRGRLELLGVPVRILDPGLNGKSCIVLSGPSRSYFPQKVQGIDAGNDCFGRLFFLHTLAWSSHKAVGEYRINYLDGTVESVPIVDGLNIGDWWFPNDLPQAPVAYVEKNPADRAVGLWLFAWENPKPAVPIASIDFISNGNSVPALVAVSGEKINQNSLLIDDFEQEKKWSALRDKKAPGEPAPKVERVKRQDDPEGVRQGDYALKVSMPMKTAAGGAPVIFTKFALDKLKAGAKYHSLVFWIKADSPSSLLVTLPKADWSAKLQCELMVRAGQWQKVRLDLQKDLGLESSAWQLDELRGEFFIYYQNGSPLTFYLDEIRFE